MSNEVQDPWKHWDSLTPEERARHAKRVCIVGAESSGTTSLAQSLAAHYGSLWVPEYGREYTEERITRTRAFWHTDEFTHIAVEQCLREDAAVKLCNRVLICDTNAFATQIWHRRYLGTESPEVAAIAATRSYDLYLLSGDEIPFVPDRIRDGEHIRHIMHAWFEQALNAQDTRWRLLRGTHEVRMTIAIAAINMLFEHSDWQPPYGA
ncbi:MAG: hypothetical protein NVS9B10_22780 [Nevskia sp.]